MAQTSYVGLLFFALLYCFFHTGECSERVSYKQEVVIILDEDPVIQNVGKLLFQEHDTLSHTLMWNTTSQSLVLVQWDTKLEMFTEDKIYDTDSLPIGSQKTFKWAETLIQVVGCGEVIEGNEMALSGFSPEDLASLIFVNVTKGYDSHVKIVSSNDSSVPYEVANSAFMTFLQQLMLKLQQFQRFNSTVAMSSTIFALDHGGSVLTGELKQISNRSSIEWKHNEDVSNTTKFLVGFFSGETFNIKEDIEKALPWASNLPLSFYGILPPETLVHITDFGNKCSQQKLSSYAISDFQAFEWLDEVAQTTYNKIPRDHSMLAKHRVQFLFGIPDPVTVPVIEIKSIQDLLKELRYYGDKGPSVVSDSYVYYRFGDWVLSMNEMTFSVSVVGIVVSPADSDEKNAKVQKILTTLKPIPNTYPFMQPNTADDFFQDISHWIKGEQTEIGLEYEDAYNAQCGMSMFLSESIRSFHTHVSNMLSLNLAQNGYMSKEVFFSTHPMAHNGTWEIRNSKTGRKKTGLDMLHDEQAKSESLSDKEKQQIFNEIFSRMACVTKSWLSHIDNTTIKGSREQPPATKQCDDYVQCSKYLQQIVEEAIEPYRHRYDLRKYELYVSASSGLSSTFSEPEHGAVSDRVKDYSAVENSVTSLKVSIALGNDHNYISNLIKNELYKKQQQTGKMYYIVPDSIEVEENTDNVRFFVQELNHTSGFTELEQISTVFEKSKLASKRLIQKLTSKLNEPSTFEGFDNGDLMLKGALKMVGFINKLVNQQQSTCEYTTSVIFQVCTIDGGAEKYIGKCLEKLDDELFHLTVTGIKEISIFEKMDPIVKEFAYLHGFEDVEKMLPALEVVGFAVGIFNVFEDFSHHTAIGYIDAGFDIATTVTEIVFKFVEVPELQLVGVVIEIALQFLKMGVEIFYTDISNELHKLPAGASVVQKIGAVLTGIAEGIVDIVNKLNIVGYITDLINQVHKLNAEHEKDMKILHNMGNISNYFNVTGRKICIPINGTRGVNGTTATNETAGIYRTIIVGINGTDGIHGINGSGINSTSNANKTSTCKSPDEQINFAGGSESWNGGSIVFHLGESGNNSTMSIQTTDMSGKIVNRFVSFDTYGSNDMVLGIGEAHTVNLIEKKVKAFIFTIDKKEVIKDITGDKDSLHGTYYGNSQNNKFIAMQTEFNKTMQHDLKYNLSEYRYWLYGGRGNDTFYLGPELTYVEGNEGSDTYFVNPNSSLLQVNAHTQDGAQDTMVIDIEYDVLSAQRIGFDLSLTSLPTHMISVINWFLDATHQRIVFRTADGVLFKVSPTITEEVELIPYALSASTAETGQILDARQTSFSEVILIKGSDFNDTVCGNDMDNRLDGGKGSDSITGGDGKDAYTINVDEGIDVINNFAMDEAVDSLIVGANLEELVFTSENNDLHVNYLNASSHHNEEPVTCTCSHQELVSK